LNARFFYERENFSVLEDRGERLLMIKTL